MCVSLSLHKCIYAFIFFFTATHSNVYPPPPNWSPSHNVGPSKLLSPESKVVSILAMLLLFFGYKH